MIGNLTQVPRQPRQQYRSSGRRCAARGWEECRWWRPSAVPASSNRKRYCPPLSWLPKSAWLSDMEAKQASSALRPDLSLKLQTTLCEIRSVDVKGFEPVVW